MATKAPAITAPQLNRARVVSSGSITGLDTKVAMMSPPSMERCVPARLDSAPARPRQFTGGREEVAKTDIATPFVEMETRDQPRLQAIVERPNQRAQQREDAAG